MRMVATRFRRWTLWDVASTVLVASSFVWTASALAAQPSVTDPAPDPADPADFMDQFMATGMARFHAPGATVVVTREHAVVFAKGYGCADLGRQILFTTDTRFRAKLVTKTSTLPLPHTFRTSPC